MSARSIGGAARARRAHRRSRVEIQSRSRSHLLHRPEHGRLWKLGRSATRIPDRLAAIAPICGGGETYWARRYGPLPIWAFTAKDGAVPLERSEVMVEAVKKAGGNAKLTVYPEVEHDSWTQTYDDPAFYGWLFAQKRE